MNYLYILYSEKCDRYYIGFSNNVHSRLERHNAGLAIATKNCIPYKVCSSKQFANELEAVREERRIKKQKSRKYTEWLIAGNWLTRPDLYRDDPQRSYPDSYRGTGHLITRAAV